MSPDFERILDDCVARLRAGQDLEECLKSYPAQAKQLKPLLLVAARLQNIPIPQERPEAVRAGQARLLTAQAAAFGRPIGRQGRGAIWALRFALTLIIVLLITTVMTLNVSAKSIPGDPLYGIKRTIENTQLILTINPETKERLENEYSHNRFEEMQELIQIHRTANLDFQGAIESMDADEWMIGNFTVFLNSQTTLVGNASIGRIVHVQAQLRSDGTLLASRIQVLQTGEKPNEPTDQPVDTVEPGGTLEITNEANPSGGNIQPSTTSSPDENDGNHNPPVSTDTPAPSLTAVITNTQESSDSGSDSRWPTRTWNFNSPTPKNSSSGDSSPTLTPTPPPGEQTEPSATPVPSITPGYSPTPTPTPTPTHSRDD